MNRLLKLSQNRPDQLSSMGTGAATWACREEAPEERTLDPSS
jgi:hypothetical protein